MRSTCNERLMIWLLQDFMIQIERKMNVCERQRKRREEEG